MIIDNDEYLAHHGVKGMHWGVRNQRTSGRSAATPAQKRAGTIKFARNATIGIAVGIGAGIVAGKLVGKGMKIKKSEARATSFAAQRVASSLFGQGGSMPASNLRPKSGTGKISKDTASFLAKFAEDQTNLNRLANGDLKSLYEKGQVPLHVREYLADWT